MKKRVDFKSAFPEHFPSTSPMSLCENAGPLDFQNPCIRATWASLLPATLVLVLCLSAFPLPHVAHNFTSILKTPTIFQPFLTLEEAEALNASADGGADVETAPEKGAAVAPLWRTAILAILVFVGLAETLGWLSFGSYNIPNDAGTPWTKTLPFFVAFTWLYTVVRPVARVSPSSYPPSISFSWLKPKLVVHEYSYLGWPHQSCVRLLPLLILPPENYTADCERGEIVVCKVNEGCDGRRHDN